MSDASIATSPPMSGVLLAERGSERVDAPGDPLALLAELRSEAVAGPMRRGAAARRGEAGMLRDQVGNARPRRQRIERLHDARAEHRPRPIPLPTRRPERVKLRHQR